MRRKREDDEARKEDKSEDGEGKVGEGRMEKGLSRKK